MRRVYSLLLVLGVFSLNLYSQDENKKQVLPLEIGSDMPDFNLPGVDERNYNQEDFSNEDILVIIFTCNHCPTAQAYEERIIDLHNDYSSKGVLFVAISPNSNTALSLSECGYSDLDDSFEAMKIRAKDISLPFPYLFDGETSETSMKFGPVATPHVFIFDQERKLRYRGRIDDMESPYEKPSSKDTREALESLLAGETVKNPTTKTFGCSVKWPWKDEWTKQLIENWAKENVSLEDVNHAKLEEVITNNGENLRLVNVWATYCGPCLMEFPDLVETYRMYDGRGFDFVSVSMDRASNREKVLEFLDKNQSSDINYIWTGKSAYDAIDIVDKEWQGSLPYTMLIKPGGEVVYKTSGPVNILELRKAIISELGRYFADD